MKVLEETVIPYNAGKAFIVRKGQRIRITGESTQYRGVEPDIVDPELTTPLMAATYGGNIGLASLLLKPPIPANAALRALVGRCKN